MSALPTIIPADDFARRLVDLILGTAAGKRSAFILGVRPSSDGLLCAFGTGHTLVGAKIDGDYAHLEGPRVGWIGRKAAHEIAFWMAARADEDEANERLSEVVHANQSAILALYQKKFPTPANDPAIRRMEELFGLVESAGSVPEGRP